MNRVKTYNDFFTDLILEGLDQGDLPFKLTKRLAELLDKIDHELSNKMLEDNQSNKSAKFTLVDYDDDNIDMFTFAISPKIIDYIKIRKFKTGYQKDELDLFDELTSDKTNSVWKENRSPIKIGKFINKLYPNTYPIAGKPGEDIESFVNTIKAERTKTLGNFKIVEGDDILKYYDRSNYEHGGQGSPLWGSCMADKKCQTYIGFYPHNNVKLVVLMSSDGNTIRGRAILWDIDEIDGERVERKFMDRIYVIKQHDIEKFINLAENNGWLYKKSQDMWDGTHIVDTNDDSSRIRSMVIHNIKEYIAYPYMDTMKCFNVKENYLTNNHNLDYDFRLESPDGGFMDKRNNEFAYDSDGETLVDVSEMIWSDEEERYLNPDHAVRSEHASEWASVEYAQEHWVHSDPEDDWIPKDDAVYIKGIRGYVSSEYAEDNYMECRYDGEWYDFDDGLPSEKWGIVPHNKIIVVITSDEIDPDDYDGSSLKNLDLGDGIDVRWKGDKSYFTIYCEKENKTYHLDNEFKGSEFAKQIKKGGY